jgi:hypothetical protein
MATPGRPRQPYCPDCKRSGRPEIPKEKGGSYCADHRKLRQLAYREADPDDNRPSEEIVLDYTRKVNAELRDELKDLRQVVEMLEAANVRLLQDAEKEVRKQHRLELGQARGRSYELQEILHDRFPDEFCHPRDNTD